MMLKVVAADPDLGADSFHRAASDTYDAGPPVLFFALYCVFGITLFHIEETQGCQQNFSKT